MVSVFLALHLFAQAPAAAPCTAPEYRQFDFWVGDWVVHDAKGQQVGTNRIERVENGCGLLEQWTGAGGVTGRSLNVYQPAAKRWVQVWAGAGGLTLLLEGAYTGDRMVLSGESIDPKGQRIRNRITWSRLDGGKVRQLWEQSSDGGTTWTVAFDGIYSRQAGAPRGL